MNPQKFFDLQIRRLVSTAIEIDWLKRPAQFDMYFTLNTVIFTKQVLQWIYFYYFESLLVLDVTFSFFSAEHDQTVKVLKVRNI